MPRSATSSRFNATVGTLDWSVSAYRGFEAFPLVSLEGAGLQASLLSTHPRFTMVGADFENGGSDRFIDATFAWGDVSAIKSRIQEHFDAGASHVIAVDPVARSRIHGIGWLLIDRVPPTVSSSPHSTKARSMT